jgi:hypothetical protein
MLYLQTLHMSSREEKGEGGRQEAIISSIVCPPYFFVPGHWTEASCGHFLLKGAWERPFILVIDRAPVVRKRLAFPEDER